MKLQNYGTNCFHWIRDSQHLWSTSLPLWIKLSSNTVDSNLWLQNEDCICKTWVTIPFLELQNRLCVFCDFTVETLRHQHAQFSLFAQKYVFFHKLIAVELGKKKVTEYVNSVTGHGATSCFSKGFKDYPHTYPNMQHHEILSDIREIQCNSCCQHDAWHFKSKWTISPFTSSQNSGDIVDCLVMSLSLTVTVITPHTVCLLEKRCRLCLTQAPDYMSITELINHWRISIFNFKAIKLCTEKLSSNPPTVHSDLPDCH